MSKIRKDYFINEDIPIYQCPDHFCFNTDTKCLASFIKLKNTNSNELSLLNMQMKSLKSDFDQLKSEIVKNIDVPNATIEEESVVNSVHGKNLKKGMISECRRMAQITCFIL